MDYKDKLRQIPLGLAAGLATLVLVDRPGIPCDPPPPGWPFHRVEIPRVEVASTDLRERVQDGRPLDLLVAPGVWSLIRDRRLYGFGSS